LNSALLLRYAHARHRRSSAAAKASEEMVEASAVIAADSLDPGDVDWQRGRVVVAVGAVVCHARVSRR